jgi:protein TonB
VEQVALASKPITADVVPEAAAANEDARSSAGTVATNVVVLADDPALLEMLKHSLDGRQRVWRADDPMHAADLLVAAQSGVLLVDAALTTHETPGLIDRLHEQFPDLPIVVAGRRDDEIELGQRISNGVVFRFLHKPVSAERVRNFIDAAVRRAGDRPVAEPRKLEFDAIAAARSIRLPRLRLDPALVRRGARLAALPLGVALALWALVAIVQQRPWERVSLPSLPAAVRPAAPVASSPPAGPSENARLLGAAAIALTQGRLAEPEGQNAIELYRAVLIRDPGNREARDGLERTAQALLARVELLLLAGDVTGAAGALDAARSADPSHPRLEFFSSQLQRERGRTPAATPGTPGQGAALAELALAGQVNGLLAEANARMQAGRLAGGTDTAETLVLEARRLSPADPGVQQALNALSGRMLLASREALGAGDSRTATLWLDRAEALGVDTTAVARLRAEMASMRLASAQEDLSRLLALANQRIAQDRLLEPATDSARHYVDLLRATNPDYDGLAETERLLAARLLERARSLTRDGQYRQAERFIGAADAAGARAVDLAVVRDQVAAGQALERAAGEVLPESALTRKAHQPVRYPVRARDRRIEGWVEVEYTVARDGTTRDITVLHASPEGVFEDATLDAIGAWLYEPRIVAGQSVDQRVRLRVVYQLGGD